MANPALNNLANQIKKTSSSLPGKIVDETSEVLDEAWNQILGSKTNEVSSARQNNNILGIEEASFSQTDQENQKRKDLSRLRELERELAEVRIQKIVEELQKKIMSGEHVYLENYPEIPIEQKQVLKAQMEAVRQRMVAQAQEQKTNPEPSTKPSRRLFGFGGSKKHAEDLQKSTETRMPPSG